jgi:hypothetical protein
MSLTEHLQHCFEKAERLESNISPEIIAMEGMTGLKTRHFLNNLLSMEDARYLEIGVWKGSSACSALYGNKAVAVLIDNFSGFGGPKAEFLANLERFEGENDVEFIENDCFKIFDPLVLPPFNIYFFDGDHSEEAQRKALTHFLPAMEDEFIFIVDDWNWPQVRSGTSMGIFDSNLSVEYSHFIRLTANDRHTHEDKSLPEGTAEKTWWNGLAAFVLKKP